MQVIAVPPITIEASRRRREAAALQHMRDHDDRGLVHDVIGKDRVGQVAPRAASPLLSQRRAKPSTATMQSH